MTAACRAEHIAVGSEILLGQIANGHAQTISRAFALHGFFLFHHTAVGDNFERIVKVFEVAARRSNVVVVTGGLGPTDDDLTKEALAAFLGRPSELSPEALRQLESWFAARGRKMPEQNRKQAYRIAGGELLPNPNGTAPGVYVCANGVHYFLLPGPPLEMEPMLQHEVIPRLKQIFGGGQVLVSRVIHFCGIGESDVDAAIKDLTGMANPTVAPLAGEGEMLLRITAAADHEEGARALIQPVEDEILRRFGSYVYGFDDETIASAVGKALRQAGATLAVAESCTGGLVSSMITAVPGASDYMLGGVTAYHNQAKVAWLGVREETLARFGAVSEQTALEMAQGVRERFAATYGLATTGIAGPGGGSPQKPVGLVFGAVVGPDGRQTVVRMQWRGSREQVRLRSAKRVLWELLKLVSPRAEAFPGAQSRA
ncbi:putative competence-damage inducible protein [Alicyclobacillus cellulosilyticus]|uniref:Putative competence-damage inducible protein n=1 Tax=Alicyclobacillus cellulosilyticus TaxID=1003997 RepID=A0A917KAG5_9BACL|nr:competence/damage-inducible protein A [Alicyclobacillus cellulosilyticus]GGJ04541.1 putative competence-damage inducible protein [Alicyclobacillus cellulosilyticus]